MVDNSNRSVKLFKNGNSWWEDGEPGWFSILVEALFFWIPIILPSISLVLCKIRIFPLLCYCLWWFHICYVIPCELVYKCHEHSR